MKIDIIAPAGMVHFPMAQHPENKEIYVGWAVIETIIHKHKKLELKFWNIHIRPKYRNRGYASDLIRGILEFYSSYLKDDEKIEAWTNYEKKSDYGAKAFINAGFEIVEIKRKYEVNKLVWESKKRNGSP